MDSLPKIYGSAGSIPTLPKAGVQTIEFGIPIPPKQGRKSARALRLSRQLAESPPRQNGGQDKRAKYGKYGKYGLLSEMAYLLEPVKRWRVRAPKHRFWGRRQAGDS